MSVNLPYGLVQPTTGDFGSTFFPQLEALFQRMVSHSHNNIDSPPILPYSINSVSVTAPHASWSSVKLGKYSQNVTLPTGVTYSNNLIQVRLTNGKEVNPTIVKVSETVITLYTSDNTQDYVVFCK